MMKKRKDIFEEILKDFEKKMEEIIKTLEEPRKVKRQTFSIKIQQGENGPEVFVQRSDGKKRETQHLKLESHERKETPKRKVKQFIEPMTRIIKRGNTIILEAILPRVNRGDIEITQLKRSIELRAYTGKIGYFCIFPVPKGYQILKDDFENGRYRLFVEV